MNVKIYFDFPTSTVFSDHLYNRYLQMEYSLSLSGIQKTINRNILDTLCA